jgi:hypothetical protein
VSCTAPSVGFRAFHFWSAERAATFKFDERSGDSRPLPGRAAEDARPGRGASGYSSRGGQRNAAFELRGLAKPSTGKAATSPLATKARRVA